MGNTETKERLGARVVIARKKLENDEKSVLSQLEYMKSRSPEFLSYIIENIRIAFKNKAPFSQETILLGWFTNNKKIEDIIIETCNKLLKQPINKNEFEWFNKYILPSSVLFFKSYKNNKNMSDKTHIFHYIIEIASTYSKDIMNEMDLIFADLKKTKEWPNLIKISNRKDIQRQDNKSVGLLTHKSLLKFKDQFKDEKNDEKDEKDGTNFEHFIDTNMATNILISTAYGLNKEFQNYIKIVMSEYGKFQPGPLKSLDRIQSKLENDYINELWPRCAKILDIIRCSITFNTLSQLIKGFNHLIKHINKHNDTLKIARIKNGFTSGHAAGGYRDIKVNVVFISSILNNQEHNRMICEIQLILSQYLWEKKKIHKLYSILRQETFFKMVIKQNNDSVTTTNNNNQIKKISKLDKIFALKTCESDVEQAYNGCINSSFNILAISGYDYGYGANDPGSKVWFYDLTNNKLIDVRNTHHWWNSISWFGENEKYFAYQSAKNLINILMINSNNKLVNYKKINTYNKEITYFLFDGKGDNIIIILNKNEIEKRSIENSAEIIVNMKLDESITFGQSKRLELSKSGNYCGISTKTSNFLLIDLKNNKQKIFNTLKIVKTLSPCFIGGNDKLLAIASSNGEIEIWDIINGKCIKYLKASTKQISWLYSIHNILASVGDEKILKVYNTNNWSVMYNQSVPFDGDAVSLTLSANLKYVTITGDGGDVGIIYEIKL